MTGLVEYLFGVSSFAPLGDCLHWRMDLVSLHVVGDGAIAGAFLVIAAALFRVRGALDNPDHRTLANIFALFLGLSAVTHIVGAVTLWLPAYGLHGVVKATTAIAAILAAGVILTLARPARDALRLKSENEALRAQIARAEAAEQRLQERERDLREALSHARAASASKSAFLAAMSHDLRTPLNAIIGFSGGMLSGHLTPRPEGSQKRYLTHINDSGRRLLAMVDEVLDLASLNSGNVKPEIEAVDLDATIAIPVREVQAQAMPRGVRIIFRNRAGHRPVMTDPGVIQRIAANLLGNAARHASEGGFARLTCSVDRDTLSMLVEDDGPGFPPDRIEELRQPFAMLEARKGGHGLGLAIVDGLCRAHGGRLLIANGEAGGARVEARLPLGECIAPRTVAPRGNVA